MSVASCERCGSELLDGDLRCPMCALAIAASPKADLPNAHSQQGAAQVLRCEGCGASVSYNVEVQAPACAFCRAVVKLETEADPLEEAEYFPAFEVDESAAQAAIQKFWRAPRFFSPGNLSRTAMLQDLKPLRWVAWVFDVQALVSWSADTDAGAQRANFAPHAGQFEETYRHVVVSASRGLTKEETARLAPHYRVDKLSLASSSTDRHDQELGSPVLVERFSVQRSSARKAIRGALLNLAQKSAEAHLPGSRFRNLHVEIVPRRLETRRVAFPAYVAVYRYDGKIFRAIVHGTNRECVVGKAPISWLKVMLVAALVGAAIALIVLGIR